MEGRKRRKGGGEEEVEGGRGGRREGWRGWRMEGGHENEEEHKEEEEERKGERKGGEGWKLINRVKHCEFISSMYTPLTLLTQYTACLSLCCLSISGTSHWRPRWPQRKCLAHSIMRLHSGGLFCGKERWGESHSDAVN